MPPKQKNQFTPHKAQLCGTATIQTALGRRTQQLLSLGPNSRRRRMRTLIPSDSQQHSGVSKFFPALRWEQHMLLREKGKRPRQKIRNETSWQISIYSEHISLDVSGLDFDALVLCFQFIVLAIVQKQKQCIFIHISTNSGILTPKKKKTIMQWLFKKIAMRWPQSKWTSEGRIFFPPDSILTKWLLAVQQICDLDHPRCNVKSM